MFNLGDRVKVYCGEHEGKEGVIKCMRYPPNEIPIFTLELTDGTIIKVEVVNL